MDDSQYVPIEQAAEKLLTQQPLPPPTKEVSPVTPASPTDTTQNGGQEVKAATRIQASFRGFRARTQVTTMKYPDKFPMTGPLASQGILPPKKILRNPVYAAITDGHDGGWGCPSQANHQTLHFDAHIASFPPQLRGIYTPEEWTSLLVKLNATLHSTYLPTCPAGLLVLIPIIGALACYCWRDSLATRRLGDLQKRMAAESERLAPWGLEWIVIPIWSGGHEERGEVSMFVLELVMTYLPYGKENHHQKYHKLRLTNNRSQAQAAPKTQTMDGLPTAHVPTKSTTNKQSSDTTFVQVLPSS